MNARFRQYYAIDTTESGSLEIKICCSQSTRRCSSSKDEIIVFSQMMKDRCASNPHRVCQANAIFVQIAPSTTRWLKQRIAIVICLQTRLHICLSGGVRAGKTRPFSDIDSWTLSVRSLGIFASIHFSKTRLSGPISA